MSGPRNNKQEKKKNYPLKTGGNINSSCRWMPPMLIMNKKNRYSWLPIGSNALKNEEEELICIAQNHLIKGLALRMWPMLLTRSLRMQTGNKWMFWGTFSRHKTYGKLSWSRDVKRTTSLNHRHINKFDNGVCSLTITEASARAVRDNSLRSEQEN